MPQKCDRWPEPPNSSQIKANQIVQYLVPFHRRLFLDSVTGNKKSSMYAYGALNKHQNQGNLISYVFVICMSDSGASPAAGGA